MASAKLRILETTDLHMRLDSYDEVHAVSGAWAGLAGLLPVIKEARSEGLPTLLFDNGDFLQGTPLADALMGNSSDDTHPMVHAFNTLGYDAITLGNHEFNYPLSKLKRTLGLSQAPVVCANVRDANADPIFTPWSILERSLPCDDGTSRTIRIGVIGFVAPKAAVWDCLDLSEPIMADDILESARTHIPTLRAAGADIVIALAHCGIDDGPDFPKMDNAGFYLAQMPDIDVLLTGHTHHLFPSADFAHIAKADLQTGALYETPTVMAGFFGSHLGQIDLSLSITPDGWSISGFETLLRPAQRHVLGSHLDTPYLKTMRAETCRILDQPLTRCGTAISSHFAAIGFDPASALSARSNSALVRQMIADGPFASLPVIASATSFCMGGRSGPFNYLNVRPGSLTKRDAYAIAPFNNPVAAVRRSGSQVRAWLEHAAGFFQQIKTGLKNQALINPMVPSYHFDTLHGLTYRFDLSKPALGGRVVDVMYHGQEMQDDDVFVVATNSFRVGGGGGLAPVDPEDVIFLAGIGVADALFQHLQATEEIIPPTDPVWSLAPLPDTSVVFASAPDATASGLPVRLTRLDQNKDGFSQFRLTL